jgi:hypothetical protein
VAAKKQPGQKKKRVGGSGHDDATKRTKRGVAVAAGGEPEADSLAHNC